MTAEKIKHDQQQDELVSCDVCMKSVPRSAAKSVEVDDYVAHFCGLDCYQSWLAEDEDVDEGGNH